MTKKSLTRRQFLETTSAGLAVAASAPRRVRASGNPNALALHGGTPVRTKPFPGWPQTGEVDEENILKALRNHRWCAMDGEFMAKFEKAWAERVGTRGCVMTPCGTHALNLSLQLLGVGPGDEVIVSVYTWIATIDAILMNYALPVFADSDLQTFQVDPDDIEHRITPNTRAILPVHILGGAANLDKILPIAQKHNLPVIEDACQGHLVEWKGKKVGSFGTTGCFSFQESKNLPGGEAGAMVSDDEELIQRAYSFRNFGADPKNPGHFAGRGFKFRISDFAPAVLMAQLSTRFDELCVKREKHAAYLREELKKIPGIYPQQHYPESTRQTYLCFGFRYDQEHFGGAPRAKVMEALKAEGIPVSLIYPPFNKEPIIEDNLNSRAFRTVFSNERLVKYRQQNHCPHNDELCATVLNVSNATLIAEKSDVDDILEAFNKVHVNAATLS